MRPLGGIEAVADRSAEKRQALFQQFRPPRHLSHQLLGSRPACRRGLFAQNNQVLRYVATARRLNPGQCFRERPSFIERGQKDGDVERHGFNRQSHERLQFIPR